MKRWLFALLLVMSPLITATTCTEGSITPAEAELLGCQAFGEALITLLPIRAAGELNEDTTKLLDDTRNIAAPICEGPPPNVDASVARITVDGAARVLNSIIEAREE